MKVAFIPFGMPTRSAVMPIAFEKPPESQNDPLGPRICVLTDGDIATLNPDLPGMSRSESILFARRVEGLVLARQRELAAVRKALSKQATPTPGGFTFTTAPVPQVQPGPLKA